MRKLLSLLLLLLAVPVGACNLGDILTKGSTSRSVALDIIDSTDGTPETGVVFNTSGIDLWYRREGAARTAITEATLAALTTAWSSGGFLHISDGAYRLDVPDAAFATSANYVDIGGTVTGMVVICQRVRLVDYSLEDSVRMGLTSLPNAAAAASGGLFTRGTGAGQINQDANGRIDVNIAAISTDSTSADNLELYTDGTTPQPVDTISWSGSNLLTGTGPLPGLGVLDRGTAQADGTTTLQLRSAATFADDELNGATTLVYSATTGAGQRSTVSDYVGSTDTATLSPALVVDPTGTHRYEVFAVSPAAGSVSIASGGITTASFASGAIDATAIATDAIGAAEIAADAIASSELAATAASEVGTATWATATRELTALDEDNTTMDLNATTIGTVTTATTATNLTNAPTNGDFTATMKTSIGTAVAASAVASVTGNVGGNVTGSVGSVATGGITAASVATDAIGAAELASDAATEVATAVASAQGILTGTCSSGSTTTCVDAALTQADATQLQSRLMCFSDSWCGMITTFNPGTDTATTTKVAPSTRASKTYTIFPATVE